ncbi:hypothetical protein JCM3765_005775 [Sporobolomyces pararoseus]
MQRNSLKCTTRRLLSCKRCYSSVPLPLLHPPSTPPRPGYLPPTKQFGQPLPSTHPHLLSQGELTPGIQANEYEQRRRKLMQTLEDGSLVVIAGGRIQYMSQNIFYKFRQRSNLWYLTGWEEPDSVLVLQKTSTSRGYKMTMFVRPKDPYDESWNGPRSGTDGVCQVFGADDACDIAWFSGRLEDLISKTKGPIYIDLPNVSASSLSSRRTTTSRQSTSSVSSVVPKSLFDYFSLPSATTVNSKPQDDIDGILNQLRKKDVRNAAREVERLRLIKSRAEVMVMKRAADISSQAHSDVMRLCGTASSSTKRNLTENSLVSKFEYTTSSLGSPRPAYVPVCASGENALTIHYIANNQPLKQGDMVMLDAGCEFGGYASDITRTFPVSGRFSSAQKALYSSVLRIHRKLLSICSNPSKSHSLTLEQLHRISVDLTRDELRDLGFGNLKGGDLERVLYPHFVSHPLGIDLHDTMSFGRDEKLKPGMVITIEPGLYVPPLSHFPKEFHNLSVRIEDEILIGQTEQESLILSANAPKEVEDVEATCQGMLEKAAIAT